jgi:hypothetical protein
MARREHRLDVVIERDRVRSIGKRMVPVVNAIAPVNRRAHGVYRLRALRIHQIAVVPAHRHQASQALACCFQPIVHARFARQCPTATQRLDYDDTRLAARTVHGQCGRSFQYFDALNFCGIDIQVIQIGGSQDDAIDHDQRICPVLLVGTELSRKPGTEHACLTEHADARDLAGQCGHQRATRRCLQLARSEPCHRERLQHTGCKIHSPRRNQLLKRQHDRFELDISGGALASLNHEITPDILEEAWVPHDHRERGGREPYDLERTCSAGDRAEARPP